MVLQSSRKGHFLVLRVSLSNRVKENTGANAAPLVSRLDLDLANLYSVWPLEQLNHSYTLAIDFNAVDATTRPTLRAMSQVPSFIPAAPRGEEQFPIYGLP
jgi:hypothetical protein